MKRLIATTALAATLATGAAAATDSEISMLQTYVPTVDVSMLSDAQIDEMLIIAKTTSSDTEKAQKIQAVLDANNALDTEPLTDVELNRIMNVVPDADVSLLTEAEIVELRLAIATGNDDQIERVFDTLAIGSGDLMTDGFTEAEMAMIEQIEPGVDYTKIDATEMRELRAALTAGDRDVIETVLGAALAS